jgi:hypothetical protein
MTPICKWVLGVQGYGDPAHDLTLEQAGAYFHDIYAGVIVDIFCGLVSAEGIEPST